MKQIRASEYFPIGDFPLSCWIDEHHGEMELHSHCFHELVVILRGHGRHVTSGRGYDIHAGNVFLIRNEMIHGYEQTERMSLANILFDPRRLRLPLEELSDVPGYHALFQLEPRMRSKTRFMNHLQLSPKALVEASGMIALLRQELNSREPGYRFAARTHLMSLIGFLSRTYFRTTNTKRQPLERLSQVFSFIEAHFREPIDINKLTEMAAMSKSTLTRLFHHIMGCSPIDHVIRVRLAHAAQLLQQPGIRITDAALESGFNDSNYFARQFRQLLGISPGEYRRRHVDESVRCQTVHGQEKRAVEEVGTADHPLFI